MFFKKEKPISPNYDERPEGVNPSILVFHYTGMEDMKTAKERLCNADSKVSAHYLIDEDGYIYNLVPEEKRAWHAGISYWDGIVDVNSHSIGVELVNKGHEFGYHEFSKKQMQSLLNLSYDIMSRYKINHVLGHSDVAPERKQDPGELFDWKWLAKNGVGIWAEPSKEDIENAKVIYRNDYEIEKLLADFGYNPIVPYIDKIIAFHRHFYPETFKKNEQMNISKQTVVRLVSLVRQLNIHN